MASFNDGDGVWRTISGRRVFIRSGQSISSAMKASGKFKNAAKNKKTTNRMKEEVANQKANKLANENIELYKKYGGFNLDTGNEKANAENRKAWEKWLENKDKLHKYKDESRKAGETWRNEDKKSEKNESTRNKTRMQEMAVKGAPEKDLKEQYKQSLNEVSKMEYDGKINKEEYEKAVKNINDNYINKRNEYNGINTKTGGNKNEFTREELKAKYGTDNTDVINAGKEKGDRVSLKNEKSTSKTPNTISKEEYDKMPRDYKGTLRELVDTAEFRGENKADLIKRYTDMGYDVDKDKTILSLEKGGTVLKPVKIEEKSTSDIMNEKIRSKREFTGYQAYLRDRYGTENEDIVSAGYKNKKDLYQEYKDEVVRRINKKRMEKGTTSLEQAYRKAFQEYKKEHPNTKMNLQRFIKMSEE